MSQEEIFNLPVMRHDLGETIPLRQFFHELFTLLWTENEAFNSKSPWGSSGWDYDVYATLIQHGLITGKLDEDGFVEHHNEEQAQQFVLKNIITPLFYQTK